MRVRMSPTLVAQTDRESTQPDPAAFVETDTFTNPIAPGADPWVVWHEGFYYWCASENDLAIAVYRSERLTERGEKIIVWSAPEAGPHSREIWAPELHRLDGRWFIYVAASDGDNRTHRMIVLEALADDPRDGFQFKAELYTGDHIATRAQNRWAIDGTVLEHGGQRYLLWSGWEDERDEQWLYIAPLVNPWTVASNRVRLCANDDHLWERIGETRAGRGLNEGPQVLQRDGRVFVAFSASASWEVTYKVGLLELAAGGDPMNPAAWRKHSRPILEQAGRTWGPGHNCFVRSPDGTEDWIVFHAKIETRANWKRAIHLQRFSWDAEGYPVFDAPLDPGVPMVLPGGERAETLSDEAAFAAPSRASAGHGSMVESVTVMQR